MLAALLLVSTAFAAGDLRGPFGQDPTPADRALTPRDAVGKLLVTRQDLAELVQRLDALLAGPLVRGELTGAALRAVNQRFDQISLQFFGGDFAAVHAALAEWVEELSRVRNRRRAAPRPRARGRVLAARELALPRHRAAPTRARDRCLAGTSRNDLAL
jgi:hypothetical protein